jgi:hypothetical protein
MARQSFDDTFFPPHNLLAPSPQGSGLVAVEESAGYDEPSREFHRPSYEFQLVLAGQVGLRRFEKPQAHRGAFHVDSRTLDNTAGYRSRRVKGHPKRPLLVLLHGGVATSSSVSGKPFQIRTPLTHRVEIRKD